MIRSTAHSSHVFLGSLCSAYEPTRRPVQTTPLSILEISVLEDSSVDLVGIDQEGRAFSLVSKVPTTPFEEQVVSRQALPSEEADPALSLLCLVRAPLTLFSLSARKGIFAMHSWHLYRQMIVIAASCVH